MSRSVVDAQAAPAVGPYSHAAWSGDTLFLSGQTPLDPETGKLVSGSIAEQTRRCLDNLALVLKAAGLGVEDVVKTMVFLTDMNDFGEMNEAYSAFFGNPLPARSSIGVAGLPLDARVEIEAIASRS